MAQRQLISFVCFTAAAIWPTFVNWLGSALMSPLQRAARDSFCGALPAAELSVLGHCAVCWTGSASLIAAGLGVFLMHQRTALAWLSHRA